MEATEEALDYAGGDRGFAIWLSEVDRLVQSNSGMKLFDLEDFMLKDSYDSGDSPKDCYNMIAMYSTLRLRKESS